MPFLFDKNLTRSVYNILYSIKKLLFQQFDVKNILKKDRIHISINVEGISNISIFTILSIRLYVSHR